MTMPSLSPVPTLTQAPKPEPTFATVATRGLRSIEVLGEMERSGRFYDRQDLALMSAHAPFAPGDAKKHNLVFRRGIGVSRDDFTTREAYHFGERSRLCVPSVEVAYAAGLEVPYETLDRYAERWRLKIILVMHEVVSASGRWSPNVPRILGFRKGNRGHWWFIAFAAFEFHKWRRRETGLLFLDAPVGGDQPALF